MEKKEVKLSPQALQRLALVGVVVFGLTMAYAIHATNEVIADIDHYYGQSSQQQLIEPPSDQ